MKHNFITEKNNGQFIGKHLNFEAQEAYNLLRTNLLFSFSNDNPCHIVGITSALRGDGKSLSSINCVYSFGVAGKKVLLIECDLRLPTVSENLNLPKAPGLSNFLAGQCGKEEIIQQSNINSNVNVIVSGNIPPNPCELLSSPKMKSLLTELSVDYDFIILDMPPISAVSDALILSPLLDGMIVVVRYNYTDCGVLLKTMRQFEYADVKILGFILNDYVERRTGYYKQYEKKYRKHEKYYKK